MNKNNTNVLLGITGGVAAYKILELLRLLVKKGFKVKVVLTEAALNFVTPFSFLSLGAEEVFTDLDQFSVKDGSSIHLSLSRWAHVILVAPATADIVAKIANGISDNLLLTTILASKNPVLIAPSMNENMFLNPITQSNLEKLKTLGFKIIEPEEGYLADLQKGKGRLKGVEDLFEDIMYFLYDKPFLNKKVLVTAGATREFIDPVRFITNASSGKMGIALAKVAKRLGANVTLVFGEVSERIPEVDRSIHVTTTEEMKNCVIENLKEADILLMAAAPADYKPTTYTDKKLPKLDKYDLKLEKTDDILKEASKYKINKLFVGFALQTEDLIENAKNKLLEKNLDFIVANTPSNIGVDRGKITLISKALDMFEFEGTKEEIAHFIFLKII
ncbi:MAG: bifunctional phosphopantothenoylcysteine decarboxylase/phosphopantothenate--cysteine ligase CoaBC [Caldisericaceae bacterium]